MKNLLLRGELNSFGELLHVAWESKKRFSPRITTPVIDELYEEARTHGAIGGKVIGAGGGGYMLLYCEFERKHDVVRALKKIGAVLTKFTFETRGIQNWRVNEIRKQS
jgi:D-glycero-alpha-D-manno-heptose-7-phosphate kinase